LTLRKSMQDSQSLGFVPRLVEKRLAERFITRLSS
jgi:hypothetical protein